MAKADIEESIDQLDGWFKALTYGGAPDDRIMDLLQRWLYGASKDWLISGCSQESLKQHLPALEHIIRSFVEGVLESEADDLKAAKLELKGKGRKPGRFDDRQAMTEVLATEPAFRRLETWYREHKAQHEANP